MEKLKEIENINGVGIPGLKARLLKRTDNKAIYLRDDGVYEVFAIKIREARIAFDKEYPEHERYPGNEDFGKTAWCYSRAGKELAFKRYESLPR